MALGIDNMIPIYPMFYQLKGDYKPELFENDCIFVVVVDHFPYYERL